MAKMKWLRKLRGKGGGMIKEIDHAAIVVSDMDRAFEFYCGVLGLKVLLDGRSSGGEKKSFLGNGKRALIALTEDKDRKTGGGDIVNHIAFLVDDLGKSSNMLKEKGINFIEEKKDNSGKTTAYHFLDPDGLELEICVPSDEDVPQY